MSFSIPVALRKLLERVGILKRRSDGYLRARELVENIAKDAAKKAGIEYSSSPIELSEIDHIVNEYLDYICEYAENLGVTEDPEIYLKKYKAMAEPMRHLAVCNLCLGQVVNGGFAQFYHNSDGVTANEVVIGFEETGEPALAQLVRETFGYFGGNVPRDRVERQNILNDFGRDEGCYKAYEHFDLHDGKFFELIRDPDKEFSVADGYMKRIIARYPDLLK